MNTEISSYYDLLLIHAGCTLFLCGLIWIIQVVHYPLFAYVGHDGYEQYQQLHMQRITWIVAPIMIGEVVCALTLMNAPVPHHRFLLGIGLGLLALIWLSTVLFQVPAHTELTKGWNEDAYTSLVLSNWIRTCAWSLRGGIALLLLRSV